LSRFRKDSIQSPEPFQNDKNERAKVKNGGIDDNENENDDGDED
jgi:hypothetical protein